MPQFSVYRNTDVESANAYPYFVDIRKGLLDGLISRVVIPLGRPDSAGSAFPSQLCPKLLVNGEGLILLTYQITTVPNSYLGEVAVDIEDQRNHIVAALDFLVGGV